MNILVVHKRIPFPLYYGSSRRVYHPFKILAEKHKVVFYCAIDSSAQLEYLPEITNQFSGIYYVDKNELGRRCLPGRIHNILRGNPSSITRYQYPNFYSRVTNEIKQIIFREKIDIIHTHSEYMAQFTNDMKNIPKVLDLADSETLYSLRQLQRTRISFNKKYFLSLLDFLRTRSWESRIPVFHNATILISPNDARMTQSLCPSGKFLIIPNGIDTDFFAPVAGVRENPESLVFHGHMSYPPNVDAATFLCKKIFPLLQKQFPALKIFIVGRNPANQVRALAVAEKVIVTAFLEDIRPLIAKATVSVFPLRLGGGFRNKIAEAMSMGKAVVTTSFGAEALNVKNQQHLLIADTAASFAEKIAELLQNQVLRQQMGRKARERIIEAYSWEKIAGTYESLYGDLLAFHCCG